MSALGNEDTVVLNVLLSCKETKTSKIKQIHFKSLPITPLEIKKKIEEDFSIPSCVQTLHYQSMILKDSDQLQHTHFRSGDTFTVDYPIEAECELTQNVIKWLKELYEMLRSIEECILSPNIGGEIENLKDLLMGVRERDDPGGLYTLFSPWGDKKKQINHFYFHQEGGLDLLMKVYGILVSKEWGDLGINKLSHIDLESICSEAICNYARILPLERQVVQLGGLEICIKALLRKQLCRNERILDLDIYETLSCALAALLNLSELPDCHMPLAMRTDVIDQALAIAMQPLPDCDTASSSAAMIQCITQTPQAHTYIVRKEVMEDMLKVCELKQKMVSEQSLQSQQEKEDPMAVNALKCYTSIALAQVGLGSPHLLFDSIPPHLLHQILNLMSDMLEAASPAEIRQYEEKEEVIWGTFLPYLRYLYKPATENSDEGGHIKAKLYISCCNVLLHGLENTLGRELHLEVLLKEGLLDYTMCLPAILPGECQPKARSLVDELGKHRQLQPPSLCTLAKVRIAKTFCGLQPVMEMNSIGEFIQKYFSTS